MSLWSFVFVVDGTLALALHALNIYSYRITMKQPVQHTLVGAREPLSLGIKWCRQSNLLVC